MCERLSGSMMLVAMAAAIALISVSIDSTVAQAPAPSGAAPTRAVITPWGEPDLQGIWTDEFDTPFQRPAPYVNQEFFSEAQREELDQERSAQVGRRLTERDLAGGYNFAIWMTRKRTGTRTSLISDPPDGRIPPLTGEAQKAAAADEEFRLALLQATDTCKNNAARCNGGEYTPRRAAPRRQSPAPAK